MDSSPDTSPSPRIEEIKGRSHIFKALTRGSIAKVPQLWPIAMNGAIDEMRAEIYAMRYIEDEDLTKTITALRNAAMEESVFPSVHPPEYIHVLTETIFFMGYELRDHTDDIVQVAPVLFRLFNSQVNPTEKQVHAMEGILKAGAAITVNVASDPNTPKVQ